MFNATQLKVCDTMMRQFLYSIFLYFIRYATMRRSCKGNTIPYNCSVAKRRLNFCDRPSFAFAKKCVLRSACKVIDQLPTLPHTMEMWTTLEMWKNIEILPHYHNDWKSGKIFNFTHFTTGMTITMT